MGDVQKLETLKSFGDPFYKVGAIVRLNSGSPPLTITYIPTEQNEIDAISVVWFEGQIEHMSAFPRACLTWRPEDNGVVSVPE